MMSNDADTPNAWRWFPNMSFASNVRREGLPNDSQEFSKRAQEIPESSPEVHRRFPEDSAKVPEESPNVPNVPEASLKAPDIPEGSPKVPEGSRSFPKGFQSFVSVSEGPTVLKGLRLGASVHVHAARPPSTSDGRQNGSRQQKMAAGLSFLLN